jgi:hypothetical protein
MSATFVAACVFLLFPNQLHAQFYSAEASLRVEVTPHETEVYVDGYYSGIVDDFDGFFQRLRLEPGEHDIELYLDGYRTVRQRIFLQRGGTFRLRHAMERLAAGEAPEPRPSTPPAQPPVGPRREPGPPPGPRGGVPPPGGNASDSGSIAIRVQPADAEVLIDGERWQGPDANEQLVLQVASGRHRIEVRRDGYRAYTSEIDVPPGETTTLNVSLTRQ